MNGFTALLKDERGAALTEYALVLAFLAIAAIAALNVLSSAVQGGLTNAAHQLQASQTAS